MYRFFSPPIKLFGLGLLLLVMLYCAVSRLILLQVPSYKPELETWLAEQLGMPVTIGVLDSNWVGFDPVLEAREVSVNGAENASLHIIRVRFSFLFSVLRMGLAVHSVELERLFVRLQQNDDSFWQFGNILLAQDPATTDTSSQDLPELPEWLKLEGAAFWVNQSRFLLTDKYGVDRNWRAPQVHLKHQREAILASGHILEPGTESTMFSFALEGQGIGAAEPVSTEIYLELRSGALFDEILKTYRWQGLAIQDVDASGRVWLHFEDTLLRFATGEVQLREMNWRLQEESQVPLQNFVTHFDYHRDTAEQVDTQTLTIRGLRFGPPQSECAPTTVQLRKIDELIEIAADQLSVSCVVDLADATGFLQGTLGERLQVSQPQGSLENILVTVPWAAPEIMASSQTEPTRDAPIIENASVSNAEFDPLAPEEESPSSEDSPAFRLQAELRDIAIQPYGATPGGTGIHGYLEARPGSGRVIFDSNRFSLFFPTLYHRPFEARKAEGSVHWQVTDHRVHVFSRGVRLYTSQDSLVYGDFIVRLNPEAQEDKLALLLGVQDVPFPEVIDYVPYTINPAIYDWLGQSMQGGKVSHGIYVGYGSIERDAPQNSFTSSFVMQAEQGELKFQPNWPMLTNLNAQVELQDDQLTVLADEPAVLHGHPVRDLSVRLDPDFNRAQRQGLSTLQVALRTELVDDQLQYWLAESPVSANTQALASQLRLKGRVPAKVKLLVPLEGEAETEYDVRLALGDDTLYHLPSELTLEQLRGELEISSARQVYAAGVQARLFGQSAWLDLESLAATSNRAAETLLRIQSRMELQHWLPHYKLPGLRGLGGGFDFNAALHVREGESPHLELRSNTIGVTRDWPKPLFKSPEKSEMLTVNAWFEPEHTRMKVAWDVSRRIALKADAHFSATKFERGEILVGNAETHALNEPGLFVRVNVPYLKLAPWVDFWTDSESFVVDHSPPDNASPSSASGVVSAAPVAPQDNSGLQIVTLRAAHLDAYGQLLRDVSTKMIPAGARWDILLEGPSIAGNMVLPGNAEPLEFNLDYLILPESDPDAEPTPEEELAALRAQTDPRKLPAMRIAIADLRVGSLAYGNWRTQLIPTAEGVLFNPIRGNLAGATVKGRLEWKKLDATVHSSLAILNMEGKDVAPPLEAFGINDLITSDRFESELAVQWNDMPSNFELAKLSGSIRLNMEKGVLKTDDKKTGFLRVFGVLNPQTIFRRLQLDFSDLVQSGVSYDTLSVLASMDQGQMTLQEPLLIKGPSSNYDISGAIDMHNKQLDLGMVVALPLNENVPLAALVLGAPVIGGAVWVVDKLLGEPLSALTTAGYSITGPWSDPKVELNQVVNAGERKVLKKLPSSTGKNKTRRQ